MNGDFEEFLAYCTHLRNEHRRLHNCLNHVEQLWLGENADKTTVLPPAELITSLEALRGAGTPF